MNVINGINSVNGQSEYEQLLEQFYRAFNQQDIALMKKNWSLSDDAVMSNPLGGKKKGWPQIEAVYDSIFNGPADVYVEFYDYTIVAVPDMFCAAGKERGRFKVGNTEIELDIRTSRIYKKIDQQWLQVHHHGSIDNPELLADYQQAVKQ